MTSSKPWWRTDEYVGEAALPLSFSLYEGPKGVALVRAWPSGITDPGWGLNPPKNSNDGFMPRYMRGEFDKRRVLHGYAKGNWAFAIVMRSVSLVCIDIDGKNGGLEHARRLGALPRTLAETSKSGDGYHLFYSIAEPWDSSTGFALLSDRIGIEQGVDIRATGCVYHHPQQRWNGLSPTPLPEHLYELLRSRDQKIAATTQRIESILEGEDHMEVLMMQAELEAELKRPIPQGKRNQTLFAIGSQMCLAQVPGWEKSVSERAEAVGLPADEAAKLVTNITNYGAKQASQP